jgi:hypothetical protein
VVGCRRQDENRRRRWNDGGGVFVRCRRVKGVDSGGEMVDALLLSVRMKASSEGWTKLGSHGGSVVVQRLWLAGEQIPAGAVLAAV